VLRADGRVSTVELFFDLVYVFAVTQLSHLIVRRPDLPGFVHAAVLLAMVWQLWVYTTWAINYLDPGRADVRAMLLTLMFGSLVLAAALPDAFTTRGVLVAALYAAMQVGRCVFMVLALRRERLQVVFVRILPWSLLSGAAVVVAAFVTSGYVRAAVWLLAVAVDLVGAGVGFWLPGLGRSSTREWTISGDHFAERCQAFVLIALGESIVVTGATLASLRDPGAAQIAAFVVAFAGSVVFWWIYFARAAEDSTRAISASGDPGRLARNAFHWIHPAIVFGIILAAAADERVLADPARRATPATGWLVLGGAALFLAGHALFKAVIWRIVSWPRIAGACACLLLLALTPRVSALAIDACALAVIVAVAVTDGLTYRALHPRRG
jgi:low temperature requirement protein LtrA